MARHARRLLERLNSEADPEPTTNNTKHWYSTASCTAGIASHTSYSIRSQSLMSSLHSRSHSDADWCIIETHNADPLIDLHTQRAISISEPASMLSSSPDSHDEGFAVIAHNKPSYSSIAALKGTATSSRVAPILNPVMRTTGTSASAAIPQLRASNVVVDGKYRQYQLKKSGKKYVAIKV